MALADWRRPSALAVREPRSLSVGASDLWSDVGFRAEPQLNDLIAEFDQFLEILKVAHIRVLPLTESSGLTLDSLYVRDSIALGPCGLISCSMAKPNRRAEPKTIADELATQGFPVSSCIEPPGTLEGGDVVWLDDRLCAIGLSYRTNLAGYEQFGALCSEDIEFLPVHLPHFRGPGVILHLSSLLSVVAQKVVLADIEYLPVSFLAELAQRGIAVLSIPESERSTLAANVLSIGNDTLISISGNARTQALLRSEGFSVIPVHGNQISILGDGGPTCLTRPLAFDAS